MSRLLVFLFLITNLTGSHVFAADPCAVLLGQNLSLSQTKPQAVRLADINGLPSRTLDVKYMPGQKLRVKGGNILIATISGVVKVLSPQLTPIKEFNVGGIIQPGHVQVFDDGSIAIFSASVLGAGDSPGFRGVLIVAPDGRNARSIKIPSPAEATQASYSFTNIVTDASGNQYFMVIDRAWTKKNPILLFDSAGNKKEIPHDSLFPEINFAMSPISTSDGRLILPFRKMAGIIDIANQKKSVVVGWGSGMRAPIVFNNTMALVNNIAKTNVDDNSAQYGIRVYGMQGQLIREIPVNDMMKIGSVEKLGDDKLVSIGQGFGHFLKVNIYDENGNGLVDTNVGPIFDSADGYEFAQQEILPIKRLETGAVVIPVFSTLIDSENKLKRYMQYLYIDPQSGSLVPKTIFVTEVNGNYGSYERVMSVKYDRVALQYQLELGGIPAFETVIINLNSEKPMQRFEWPKPVDGFVRSGTDSNNFPLFLVHIHEGNYLPTVSIN